MSVPEEIRKVKRPVNTIVENSGRPGPNQYPVRERFSGTYVKGGNPKPRNGKVVGHIIDGAFVPIMEKAAAHGADMKSYGTAAMIRSLCGDILEDLYGIYAAKDAQSVIAAAALKVIKPGVTDNRINTHYNRTFISEYWPGLPFSANTVSDFLQRLGQDGKKRRDFFHKRVARVEEDHHILIDGSLIQDNSTVNDLSHYCRKSRVSGVEDISMIYAYDVEKMEPVCGTVYPGNSIDASSYHSFLSDNNITKGVIIDDKGFPVAKIRDLLAENEQLHFVTPLKRNAAVIQNNDMYSFDGVLSGIAEHVLYRKVKLKGGNYLYSFQETKKQNGEFTSFVAKAQQKKNFSKEKFKQKKEAFGTITLESDLDLEPSVIYGMYTERWIIELVFRAYKSELQLDTTNVQNDYSVIGEQFINFVASLITSRIMRKAKEAGVLEEMTYGNMLEDLNEAWRKTDSPSEKPMSYDAFWVHTLPCHFELMEKLGISEPLPKAEPKKRGRKPKPKVEKPKRPRGRPKGSRNRKSLEQEA